LTYAGKQPEKQQGDKMLRRRHEEKQEHQDNGPEIYQMREKLVSIGDDFWIETDRGRRAFKVDGKAVRVRDTLVIRDLDGGEVAKLQERMLHVRDTMKIERPHKPDATIKKAMISPLRERWVLESDDVGEMKIQGNIVDHEYTFERDGEKVAETSKRWFRVRDTYGVEIQAQQDSALILAATVAIDQMSEPG
jgi:uncharacterized protein YxjI